MNDLLSALLEVEPREPVRLLEELGELSARATDDEPVRRPHVTVHLKSGRDVTGVVLRVKHVGRAPVALLHLVGPGQASAFDVVHVPIEHVEAVTVHDVVAQGRPPESAPAAPGRLDFRRKVAAWETSLQGQLGVLISVDLPELHEADLEPLDALLRQLATVLSGLVADQLGRQALVAKVERVRFALGSLPSVALHQRVLVLTTVHAFPRRMTAAALSAAIEATL